MHTIVFCVSVSKKSVLLYYMYYFPEHTLILTLRSVLV